MRHLASAVPAEDPDRTKAFIYGLHAFHGAEHIEITPVMARLLSEFLDADIQELLPFVHVVDQRRVDDARGAATRLLAELSGVDESRFTVEGLRTFYPQTAANLGDLITFLTDWYLSKALRAPQIHASNAYAFRAAQGVWELYAWRYFSDSQCDAFRRWIETCFPSPGSIVRVPDVRTIPRSPDLLLDEFANLSDLFEARTQVHRPPRRDSVADALRRYQALAGELGERAARDWPELGVTLGSAWIGATQDSRALGLSCLEAFNLARRWRAELTSPFAPYCTIEPGYWANPAGDKAFKIDTSFSVELSDRHAERMK